MRSLNLGAGVVAAARGGRDLVAMLLDEELLPQPLAARATRSANHGQLVLIGRMGRIFNATILPTWPWEMT